MPLDSTGVVLTVGRRSALRQPKTYPQLATQLRCSSGFTHVPTGRLEVLKATARPEAVSAMLPERSLSPKARAMLDLLRRLAHQDEIKLSVLNLMRQLGAGWARRDVTFTLELLAQQCLIVMEVSPEGAKFAWRMIQLLENGLVLRSVHAPQHRGPV